MEYAHKQINNNGFSLLELLVVIVIIAILLGVAYPSYQSHLIRVRRVDGQTALLNLATHLEKYALSSSQGYANATLSNLGIAPSSAEGYYQLIIISADAQHYVIAATPLKSQSKDSTCKSLAMDNLGRRGQLQGGAVIEDKKCW